MKTCCHCKVQSDHNYRRGLCWACHRNEAIRKQYPTKIRHRRGLGLNLRANAALPEPTDALPGTEAKIQVMEERIARGEALFHPLDAVRETDAEDAASVFLRQLRDPFLHTQEMTEIL